MPRRVTHTPSLFLLSIVFSALAASAIAQDTAKPKRARLPKWDKFPSHVFYRDAFQEGLVGSRPAKLGQAAAAKAVDGTPQEEAGGDSGGYAWSRIVSASTLEDEIKSLQIQIQKSITTPSRFTGGGYLDAQRMFTEAALLFAVIAEFDGDVRWKDEAPLARDLFTRAAANTKTTSVQAFNEARERKRDLEELVRGGSLTGSNPAEKMNWELIHRGSLMKRFTTSYDDGLANWASSAESLKKNAADIKREAELLMLFAEVLTREGMEDGDDEDYAAYSQGLSDAAKNVLQAAESGDVEAARKAASHVGQSCVACHDDYRG